VIGVTFVMNDSGFASLTLSTSGPECQPNLQPGEKALLTDLDRGRWYEVRLAELGAKQVTVTVEWGTGSRLSSC
jgi:hypothetical protein